MPSSKRKRGERDGPRTEKPAKPRLYLIFDDWPWGYSIRSLKLSLRSPRQRESRLPLSPPLVPRRLPPPCFRLEAPRGSAWHFAAVGTRIVAAHNRYQMSVPDGFLPIVDVRSRGINFGPAQVCLNMPIYISVGNELFALDSSSFNMLSFEKLCPPRLQVQCTMGNSEWSWFHRWDVTSYALHSDGRTILFSTAEATFAFDTKELVWERFGGCALPFTGHAHSVHALNAFVGLSKDSPRHLCSCELACDGRPVPVEVFMDEDPEGSHVVGATLVYLGGARGTEFCLVQCVSADKYCMEGLNDSLHVEKARMERVSFERVRHNGCQYRLTTFSLAYNDGFLMTGDTCLVKSYKVPGKITEAFVVAGNPVAFWL